MSSRRAGQYESTEPPPHVQHSQHSSTHGPRRHKSQHLTLGCYSHNDKIIPGEAPNARSQPHDWSTTHLMAKVPRTWDGNCKSPLRQSPASPQPTCPSPRSHLPKQHLKLAKIPSQGKDLWDRDFSQESKRSLWVMTWLLTEPNE